MNRNAKHCSFRVPTIESLDDRSMMAGINLNGQVLAIQRRDNYADVAQVILSGSSVKAVLNCESILRQPTQYALIVLALIIAVGCSPTSQAPQAPYKRSNPSITVENYDAIRAGVSINDVKALLG